LLGAVDRPRKADSDRIVAEDSEERVVHVRRRLGEI
jgi:hypothetical protein